MRKIVMVVALALTLTACTPTVSFEPAEDASDPLCASVMVALPAELGAVETEGPFTERATDAQATAAWGEPTAIRLRCGVPEPAPTTANCGTIADVDWIDLGAQGDARTFVTYGRSPAVELVVDSSRLSAATVLTEISGAVSETEQVASCVALPDVP